MSDLFRFDMRATEKDPSGYYYPRWDKARAQSVSVVAETKQEAINKAAKMLGPTTRSGWYWIFRVDKITDARLVEAVGPQ